MPTTSPPVCLPNRSPLSDCFPGPQWWLAYRDPLLTRYIEAAMAANKDLLIAANRVKQAQAQVAITRAAQFPVLDAAPNFARQWNSDTLVTPNQQQFAQTGPQFFAPGQTVNIYNIPLQASYQVDYLLQNASRTKAQKIGVEISRADERTAFVTITTEVATAYVNLIQADHLVRLQREQIRLLRQRLQLVRERYRVGLAAFNESLLVETDLNRVLAVLPELQIQQAQFAHQLATLMGRNPQKALVLPRASWSVFVPKLNIPQSIPSEALACRPDIAAAEARLQQARINISLARRAFFPDFTFNGQFGFATSQFDQLFNWDSYFATLGVNAILNLFDGGAKWGQLRSQKLTYEGLIQEYQQTILTAFQETEDSLAALRARNEVVGAQHLLRANALETLSLLRARYQQGLINQVDVLGEENNVINADKALVQAQAATLVDQFSLYRALGGGC